MGIRSGEGLRLYGFKQVMYFSLLDFGLGFRLMETVAAKQKYPPLKRSQSKI